MRSAVLAFLLLPGLAVAAEPSPVAKHEIAHLMSYLKGSGCEFNRNGSWYGTAEAVDHINQKYEYLLNKGLVTTAEDFIARAASESSMSGRPYQVRCGTAAPVESGAWLKAELVRYRASHK